MRVVVGSANPVKREATSRVFGGAVDAVAVESGVSEQPTGHAETRLGAANRARRAFETGAYDLGVGIEGGVARFGSDAGGSPLDDGLWLVMWAAVSDTDRVALGAGPLVTKVTFGHGLRHASYERSSEQRDRPSLE